MHHAIEKAYNIFYSNWFRGTRRGKVEEAEAGAGFRVMAQKLNQG